MQQVDTKAGVAHVELLQDQSPADNVEEKGAAGAGAGADATTADGANEGEGSSPPAPTPASSSVAGANGGPVFFLLKVCACVRACVQG